MQTYQSKLCIKCDDILKVFLVSYHCVLTENIAHPFQKISTDKDFEERNVCFLERKVSHSQLKGQFYLHFPLILTGQEDSHSFRWESGDMYMRRNKS